MSQGPAFFQDDEWFSALREMRMRRGKLYFGVLALVMILLGFVFYVFSDALGIDEQTAKLVAAAFLIAGLFDYLILHFWDRIYEKFGPSDS